LRKFDVHNFQSICDELASGDADLLAIIQAHGYPPMWTRPNTFETLVHVILEQQVSLASALAALNKLREKIKRITPSNVLKLSDIELKACYFSRQKTLYVRHLATAIMSRKLSLRMMQDLPDEEVRVTLTAIKGIGNWTADVYLMFVLQRADLFPMGDLAAVNTLKKIKELPKDSTRESLLNVTKRWSPHRTVATYLLWHYYLCDKRKKGLREEII
jgi:DNA-3-methyladenine glycosylase II